MTGLAEPDYDATISFGLPIEPEDTQYGKYRLNLFWSQQTPMIVAPDILSKIEGQPFSADSPFGCQTPLEITPEALQAVDVAPLPIAERLAVVHKPVDVAPRCDARVRW